MFPTTSSSQTFRSSIAYANILLCLLLLHLPLIQSQSVTSGTLTQLWPCTESSIRQTWNIIADNPPHDNIQLGGNYSVPYTGLTLNILGFSNATGGTINVWSSVLNIAQQFTYDRTTGYVRSEMNSLCIGTMNSSGVLPSGTLIVQVPCADVDTVKWIYNDTNGLFQWVKDPSLCLDAGTSVSCNDYPFSTYPYCNSSLLFSDRVNDLLTRLEPVEAAAMLSASNNGVPRLGVPKLSFGEALHGVLVGCGAAYTNTSTGYTSTGCPTSFPTGLALGSTFNRTLWGMIGTVIGKEGRALYNQNIGQSIYFTPDINPYRDPRFGRGMEVPSEDPFINGEYAGRYVYNFQYQQSEGYMVSVSFSKHFSGYDQEGNGGVHDRTHFCADIAYSDLVTYHWPSFKSAVQIGKAGGIMCSANGVNGYPSCAHSDYNNQIMRNQWMFDGAIVTDGNGVGYLYETYGNGQAMGCVPVVATGPTNACGVGLHGGVDVELGETLNNYALDAINDGNITWTDINTALSRTIQYLFRLGLMDNASMVPWSTLGPSDVDRPEHRQLAYEAAVQSIILLKNDNNTVTQSALLPLNLAQYSGKTIAIIGPNANVSQYMLANYHGSNTVVDSHTPLLTFTAACTRYNISQVRYSIGCVDGTPCQNTTGFTDALNAAKEADLIITFMGLAPSGGGVQPGTNEGEEFDRTNITLPGYQEDLLVAIANITTVPIVLVLIRGGPVSLSDSILSRTTTISSLSGTNTVTNAVTFPAIVDVRYPGEIGGDALTDILIGVQSPSGRLTTTIYPPDFPLTRSIIDYNMTSNNGITYMYYTLQPLFPFGWGLSYTTWNIVWLNTSLSTVPLEIDLYRWMMNNNSSKQEPQQQQPLYSIPSYAVNVTNTGTVASDISILAFTSLNRDTRTNHHAHPLYRTEDQPNQELFDFQRASQVLPGQTITLYFTPSLDIFSYSLTNGEMGMFINDTFTIQITGPGSTNSITSSLRIITSAEMNDTYRNGAWITVHPSPFENMLQ